MLLKEVRVCVPYTIEEFRAGALFCSERFSAQNRAAAVLQDQAVEYPSESEHVALFVRRRYKLTRLQMPAWLSSFVNQDSIMLLEKHWYEFPRTRSLYTVPVFGDRFSCCVDTIYIADAGNQDNVFGLDPEELAIRSVHSIDIADDRDGTFLPDENPQKIASKKTRRGPLAPGFMVYSSRDCDRSE